MVNRDCRYGKEHVNYYLVFRTGDYIKVIQRFSWDYIGITI